MKYEPQFHVVLHQPEIPHNTGSVGRTCVAVGAKLWLVRPLGFRVDDYYLRRAGLDYWEHLEWEVVDDWADLLGRLHAQLTITSESPPAASSLVAPYLFTKRGTQLYSEIVYRPRDVLVFGSESAGLPPSLVDAPEAVTVRIPIREPVRSLNLSNAVAIALYEACRQTAAGSA